MKQAMAQGVRLVACHVHGCDGITREELIDGVELAEWLPIWGMRAFNVNLFV
ncbi:MAG: hypothetical protein ACLVLH_15685 [Eisenbergiella massiliensis]